MKERYFDTYKDASYYAWVKGGVTISRYDGKYIVGIDPAYEYDYESDLDKKSRLRDEKIDLILDK